jgi:hypothetical protein
VKINLGNNSVKNSNLSIHAKILKITLVFDVKGIIENIKNTNLYPILVLLFFLPNLILVLLFKFKFKLYLCIKCETWLFLFCYQMYISFENSKYKNPLNVLSFFIRETKDDMCCWPCCDISNSATNTCCFEGFVDARSHGSKSHK